MQGFVSLQGCQLWIGKQYIYREVDLTDANNKRRAVTVTLVGITESPKSGLVNDQGMTFGWDVYRIE